MKFHKQTMPHVPSIGKIGDCFRTVLACLLDLEVDEVPHFHLIHWDKTAEKPWIESPAFKKHLRNWLTSKGYALIEIPYHSEEGTPPDDLMKHLASKDGEDMCYMLSGMSVVTPHVVICRGSKMLWDPSRENVGIIAPLEGAYWVGYLISGKMRYNEALPAIQ
jgi:hypothetical protein